MVSHELFLEKEPTFSSELPGCRLPASGGRISVLGHTGGPGAVPSPGRGF